MNPMAMDHDIPWHIILLVIDSIKFIDGSPIKYHNTSSHENSHSPTVVPWFPPMNFPVSPRFFMKMMTGWCFGTWIVCFHSVGNGKSSQLTFTHKPSFFRGIGQPPTRWCCWWWWWWSPTNSPCFLCFKWSRWFHVSRLTLLGSGRQASETQGPRDVDPRVGWTVVDHGLKVKTHGF